MEANFSSKPRRNRPPEDWTPPPMLPTPRPIALMVRLRILFGSAGVQVGWGVFGFGLIFFWTFGMNADVPSLYRYRGKLTTEKAIVTAAEPTNFTEGGSKSHPGVRVYRNEFTLKTPTGKTYKLSSYAVGHQLEVNAPVDIEYPAGEPEHARIVGMRTKPMSVWVLLVAIVPGVGLVFIIVGMSSNWRGCWLLENGRIAGGVLQSKEPTNTRINNQRVYRLTFAFHADDGQEYRTVARSHVTEKLEDDDFEPLFYDPANPTRTVILGSLPGPVYINGQGEFCVEEPGKSYLPLILPTLVIVVHGLWILFAYVR